MDGIRRIGWTTAAFREPFDWCYRACTNAGSERHWAIQAGKMAIAAVLAWLVARQVSPQQSFLAPYSAVFLVDDTVLRSLLGTARQLAALVLGLALAVVVVELVPNPAASLGIAVLLGALLGRWHRMRDSGVWIPVTALLVVANGAANDLDQVLTRLVESLIGVGIGASVNTFVLPPVHLSYARRAVRLLALDLSQLLHELACAVDNRETEPGTDDDRADEQVDDRSWNERARHVERSAQQAHETAQAATEETRLNPRWMWWRVRHRPFSPSRYESAIGTLHALATELQHMCEVISWPDVRDGSGTTPVLDHGTAEILDELSDVVADYDDVVLQDSRHVEAQMERLIERARDGRRDSNLWARQAGTPPDHDDDGTARLIAEFTLLTATERMAAIITEDVRSADQTLLDATAG